ncbi:hypothetical protein E0W68_10930 [Flavobacterium salilacus subsp. salilacus]|uniref:hypothetical protein n=1 Tax=Flavobacterium TaxID=237 RepID=UPI0010751790|nr:MULTISPECIES: hypothetical protein [Flavobacterium]KAF2517478.1 hypothetical protein E0W68_10930 [Flavobacterium salilacus subsp. salilacus]MBE1615622.1 hypothetical protein [Flavobacterium sp. SaA2.13]
MNTYNENLRSAIVSSLQSQNADQKDLKSKLNASMFSLYHAEGASITAEEKLEQAKKDQDAKAEIKKQGVANSNASNNELKSATQADAFVKQSISNAAVCAANVQISANAVTKLAGDVGNIYSIINAADFDTDIYAQAKVINELMNDTAYGAEYNSQLAMETSALTSEVSSAVVLNESKNTNTAIKNLLKITSDEYDTASQAVVDDNTALSLANANEKDIEGNFKYLTVDSGAAKSAYDSMNKELNQQLEVLLDDKSDTSFSVHFNKILNPFYDNVDPVKSYYLFIVKESKSNTFSISSAEGIIANQSRRFVMVNVPQQDTAILNTVAITGTNVSVQNDMITTQINFLNIDDGETLLDTEGNTITLGDNYVVFLMAVYTDEYKRSINNFSDFISAPSLPFAITTYLNAVENDDITVTPQEKEKTENDINDEQEFTAFLNQSNNGQTENSTAKKPNYSYKITFAVEQNPVYNVAYRFMLLPVYKGIGKDLLTVSAINSLINQMSSLDLINQEFDPKIEALQAQIIETELELQQAALEKNKDDEKKFKAQLSTLNSDLDTVSKEKADQIESINSTSESNIGFLFNLPLAEQVPAGSYTPAKPDSNAKKSPHKDTTNWVTYISADTTDNFGNLLIDGNEYIPVILTSAILENDDENPFTNALSDFSTRKAFTYKKL